MDSLECESLRERLLAVRANRDLTRAEVARSAGVSHDTVKKIEEAIGLFAQKGFEIAMNKANTN